MLCDPPETSLAGTDCQHRAFINKGRRTGIVRILDRKQIRLIRAEPALVVLVIVSSTFAQTNPALVKVEVLPVVFEELDEK